MRFKSRLNSILGATLCGTVCGLAACDDPTVSVGSPSLDIVDAVHNAGNEHFYFLPPLVPQPGFSGEFDSELSPSVSICELDAGVCVSPPIAEFTMVSGPGSEVVHLRAEDEHYAVNWHTNDFNLDPDKFYRISIWLSDFILGHADVDVVNSGKDLKNVDTGEYIALKDGRTLPIKFRIEVAVLPPGYAQIGPAGGSVSSPDGALVITVLPNSLDDPIVLSIEPSTAAFPEEEGIIAGMAWEFGPDGIVFDPLAEIAIVWDENLLPEDRQGQGDPIVLLRRGGGEWDPMFGALNETREQVVGFIDGFSLWALARGNTVEELVPNPVVLRKRSNPPQPRVRVDALGSGFLGRRVFWSVRDPNVAGTVAPSNGSSVDVEAVDLGSTVLDYSSIPSCSSLPNPNLCPFIGTAVYAVSANIEVLPPIASCQVDPQSGIITVAQSLQLTASAFDEFGASLPLTASWSSSNSAVVSVNSDGEVTGELPGEAMITAADENGDPCASSEITVTGPGEPDSDNDGVFDEDDLCPGTYAPTSEPGNVFGCTSQDEAFRALVGDWIGDVQQVARDGSIIKECVGNFTLNISRTDVSATTPKYLLGGGTGYSDFGAACDGGIGNDLLNQPSGVTLNSDNPFRYVSKSGLNNFFAGQGNSHCGSDVSVTIAGRRLTGSCIVQKGTSFEKRFEFEFAKP